MSTCAPNTYFDTVAKSEEDQAPWRHDRTWKTDLSFESRPTRGWFGDQFGSVLLEQEDSFKNILKYLDKHCIKVLLFESVIVSWFTCLSFDVHLPLKWPVKCSCTWSTLCKVCKTADGGLSANVLIHANPLTGCGPKGLCLTPSS